MSPRDWDAATYDRLAAPMTRWGRIVVDRLELRGDERVLDAGCGTGKVTAMLRERLPDGEIVALDGSASMVALARERLGEERVTYLVADLLEPLPVDPPVDAVLSTATFHWIPDHDRLFANLAAVMRPGAQLVAQCGGRGNIASVEAALRDMGESFEGRKTFAGARGHARRGWSAPASPTSRPGSRRSRRRSTRRTSSRTWPRSRSATTSTAWATPSGGRSSTRSRSACRRARSTTCD